MAQPPSIASNIATTIALMIRLMPFLFLRD
jgi:hypothetical protein